MSPPHDEDAPVLQAIDLRKHFPVRGTRSRKVVHAVDDVNLELYRGERGRAGGGVGLRQVHDRPAARAAHARHGRADPAARRGRHGEEPPGVPALRAPGPDDLPGPVRVAEPRAHRALHAHAQPQDPPRSPARRRARGGPGRAAGPGPAAPGRPVHRQVPARAVRRSAAARRHRPRARGRPRGAARRRADLDARRVDPPRHPQPAARPAGPPAARDPLHHARHRVGPLLRRPHDGHVRRPDRGDGRLRVRHAGPQAPVHAAAGALRAGPGRPGVPRPRRPRRGAEPGGAAQRLPVQPALPVRHRPVPHRGPAADRRRRGPRGRLLGLLRPPGPPVAGLGARRVRRAARPSTSRCWRTSR